MIEELASEAARQGVVVAWGRSYSGRGAPVPWPWTRVLDELIEEFDDDDLRDALRYSAAELTAMIPATGGLRRLTRTRPTMVVIDDLQWADPASIELLDVAGSDIPDLRLMIVTSHRTVDPPVDEHVAAA